MSKVKISLKKMCSDVLNEIYPSVKKSIGLEVKPRLKFETIEDGCVMKASGEIYTEYSFCDMFNRTITKTESDNIITVDLKKVSDMLKQYRLMFMRNTDKIIIKHLLYHEMRHLWQFQTGYKRVGTTYDVFKLDIFEVPHGFDQFEVDANEYAISMAKNGLEKAIAEVLVSQQQMPKNTLLCEKQYIEKFKQNYSAAMKSAIKYSYNPLFVVAAITARVAIKNDIKK